MEPYLPVLTALNARGVQYVVIGTGALWLHLKEFRHTERPPLADCDLFVPSDDHANLTQLLHVLHADSWQCAVWGEPVTLPLTDAQVRGKLYIRATKLVTTAAATGTAKANGGNSSSSSSSGKPKPAFEAPAALLAAGAAGAGILAALEAAARADDVQMLVLDITHELGWRDRLVGADGRTTLLRLAYPDFAAERVLCGVPADLINAKALRAAAADIAARAAAASAASASGASATASAGAGARVAIDDSALRIPTASIEHVLALKRLRNKPKDRLTIAEVEALTGPFARTSGYQPPATAADAQGATAATRAPAVVTGGGSGADSGNGGNGGGAGERSAMAQERARQLSTARDRARTRESQWFGQWTRFDVLLGVVLLVCLLRAAWDISRFGLLRPGTSGVAAGPGASAGVGVGAGAGAGAGVGVESDAERLRRSFVPARPAATVAPGSNSDAAPPPPPLTPDAAYSDAPGDDAPTVAVRPTAQPAYAA